MKTKIILLLSLMLLLQACGNSGGTEGTLEDSDKPYYFTYKTAEYSIDVPKDWEVIKAFPSDFPLGIRAAFRNNIKESDFVANVNVLRESNEEEWTNEDLAEKKLADHEEKLVNFKLISQEALTLEIGNTKSSTSLMEFTAKNEADGQTLTFLQTYLTDGEKAWTITAAYIPKEDEFTIERVDTMLKSFKLR